VQFLKTPNPKFNQVIKKFILKKSVLLRSFAVFCGLFAVVRFSKAYSESASSLPQIIHHPSAKVSFDIYRLNSS
jgi:hypothetical protein